VGAAQEDVSAQLLLGSCYYNGDDADKNPAEADRRNLKAFSTGDRALDVETILSLERPLPTGSKRLCSSAI
jgi:TPR repeat protein